MSTNGDRGWILAAVLVPGVLGLVDAAAAGAIVQLLDQNRRVEGFPSPQRHHLRTVMSRIASSSGHADTDVVGDAAPWVHDEIGTAEAAKVLGHTDRHIRRLAEAHEFGPSRMVGGRRLVSRAEVEAYRVARIHRKSD